MRNSNYSLASLFRSRIFCLIVLAGLWTMNVNAQTTLISSDFEPGDPTGWLFANNATNGWFIGTATNNGGTQSGYVSNNAGVSNAFTNTVIQTSSMYKSVTFPGGETAVILEFDWKGIGEHSTSNTPGNGTTWDYIRVSVATAAPVAGATPATADQIPIVYNAGDGFTRAYVAIPAAMATGTKNIIFTWRNDGSGGTTAGAIDNVTLVSAVPSPLTGSKTIPGNYPSIGAAFANLNAHGVGGGGVTFNVAAGSVFNETPTVLLATGTVSDPIVFQKSGGGANPLVNAVGTGNYGPVALTTSTSATGDAIITIAGGDYITFDGIDLQTTDFFTGVTAIEYGYFVRNNSATNGAQNITIRNTSVRLNRFNAVGKGIYQNASTTGGGFAATSAAGANSTNTYKNLTIKNAYNGVHLQGTAGFPDLNCEVGTTSCTSFNTIGDPATANDIGNSTTVAYGIRAGSQSGVKIYNNIVRNVTGSAVANDGIFLELFQGTSEVYNNKVQTVRNSSTSSTTGISGIAASHTTTGTHTARIYNNMVSEIVSSYTGAATATRTLKGIHIRGTGGTTAQTYEIWNNSVSIDGSLSANLNLSNTCFEIATTSGPLYTVENNIFANSTPAQGATAKHYCWASTSNTTIGPVGCVSNFNDLYIGSDQSTSGHVGRGSSLNFNTVADWTAAMTANPGTDANSISADPVFVTSPNDLHASASSTAINGAGTPPPAYITVDYDCQTRNSPHDIGADDFTPVGCVTSVGGTATLVGAASNCGPGSRTINAAGYSSGTGSTYEWEMSNDNFGTNIVGTGQTNPLTFSTGTIFSTTYYRLRVQCSTDVSIAYSNIITVTIHPLQAVSVSPATATICSGASIQLTANCESYTVSGTLSGAQEVPPVSPAGTGSVIAVYNAVTKALTMNVTFSGLTSNSNAAHIHGPAPAGVNAGVLIDLPSTIGFPLGVTSGSPTGTITLTPTQETYLFTGMLYVNIHTTVNGGGEVRAQLTATPNSCGSVTYSWNNPGTLDNATIQNPTATPTSTTTYTVTTTGAGGCTATASALVTVSIPPTTTGTSVCPGGSGTIAATSPCVSFTNSGTTINGTWTGGTDPVALRPTTSILNNSTCGFDGTITRNYVAQQFQVSVTGNYVFEMTNNATYDAMAYIVTGAFVPGNCGGGGTWVRGDDDDGAAGDEPRLGNSATGSGLMSLTAGTTYTLISTTYSLTSGTFSGSFIWTITPPGGGQIMLQSNGTIEWYDAATLGNLVGTGTPFNPVPGGIPNTNTPGTYTFYAACSFNSACRTATNFVVNSNPSASCGSTPVSCFGGSNGTASVTASGGTPGYTYLWSTTAVTSSIGGLTAGTYTVTVTDANGCTATCESIVGGPASAVVATCGATPVSCFGGSNGTANVTATGGTPGYTYLWSTTAVTSSIGGLTAGTYTVTVTDNNGCTATCESIVGGPASAVLATCGATPVSCFGGSNGTANVTASGGTPGYTYLWSTTAVTSSIGGLTAGTYTVTVTDANGCTATCESIVGGPASAVLATCGATPVSCFGGSNGTANVTASGGTPGYTYLWSTTAVTSSIGGLTAGTYTVTVTDNNGCTATCESIVGGPAAAVVATCGATPVSCFGGSNGTANVTASGGTPGYTYLWSTTAVTSSIGGLTAGTYTVTVTDNNGCTATCESIVGGPASAVLATCGATPVSCFGGNNGTANVTASGGTPGYTYLWSTTAVTSSIGGLTAGTYTVTVTDNNGCTATCESIVGGPASAVLATCGATPISCNGGSDGTANVTASGGTPGYTYLWSTTAVTSSIGGLTAGTYTVTVTDNNGCTATCESIVGSPTAISIPGTVTNVSVNGGNDGAVDITPSGGTPGYTYLWSNAAVTQDISTLTAGIYTVTVTDANGCTGTASFTVTEPGVGCTPPDITCIANQGANNGAGTCTAVVTYGAPTVTGTTPTVTYAFTGATTGSGSGDGSGSTFNEGTTTVTLTATNGCGSDNCSFDVVVTVNHATAPTSVTSDDPNNEICAGQNVMLTANGATLGTAGGSYKWYEGGCGTGSVLGSSSTLNVINPTTGSHTYYVRIEEPGCPSNTSCASITILVTGAPPAAFVGAFNGPGEACNGTVSLVTVTPVAGANVHYSWNTGSNSSVVLFSTNIGGPFSPGPFSTPTNQVYAQFGALSGNSGYYICVQGVNACGSTNNKCVWVRGVVSVPGTISPANGVACANDVKPYSCGASAGATVYNWTLGGSATPITSGQGTTNVTVTFPPAFTSGQLCVTAALACGGSSTSAPRCMTISNTPAVPGTITGPAKVCPGATGVVFSVAAVTGATGYSWTVPAGCTITSGTNTTSITVNFPTPYTGAPPVCVSATSSCASSATRCKTVGTNLPGQPGSMTGPTSNICNSTVQYSIPNVANATSYNWTNPLGTTISSGQGTTTILLQVGPAFTSGQLTVVASTLACTPGNSPPRTITIAGKPNQPGSITANPVVWCTGGFVNFSVSPVSPLPVYNWTTTNGTITAGQGTNNIDVTWGATAAGTVNVTAGNTCGTSTVRSQPFSSGCREDGTELNGQTSMLSVYPNPAHDKVTVSIDVKEGSDFTLQLMDVSGRVVLSENKMAAAGFNTFDLDLTYLSKGVYMLEVKSAQDNWKIKVVVE